MIVILSEKQLTRLKKILIEQKHQLVNNASNDEEALEQGSLRDSVDELSTVDNHPADLATELFERQKDMALRTHNKDELEKIEYALKKMEEGTYGLCEICNEEIPYDRLVAIPYTSYCIKHSEAKAVPMDRPVEEQVILPPVDNSFAGRDDKDDIHDYEDTFQVVAKYGTSETPSDFEGDLTEYDDIYGDPEEDAVNDELSSFHISDKDQLTFQLSKREIEKARKYDYLEE